MPVFKNKTENITRKNLETIYNDIVNYEKHINSYLINIQKKHITPLFTNIQTSNGKSFNYLENLSDKELLELIPQLLTAFHCDGKIMSKSIKGVRTTQLTTASWPFKPRIQK